MINTIGKGYDFDDVLLIPRVNRAINSRSDIYHMATMCTDVHSTHPIISSPMRGVSGVDLVIALGKAGGIGCLHRFFNTMDERIAAIAKVAESGEKFGVAIGIRNIDAELEIVKIAEHYKAEFICIDVANGYTYPVCEAIYKVKDVFGKAVMAGSVATQDGALELYKAGADCVRVGIGPGSVCTTRNVTGIGVPQLTAIDMCATAKNYFNEISNDCMFRSIVADGGIRSTGDIVKALAAGANYVMLGNMLATCVEAEHNGKLTGMSSREIQETFVGNVKSVEGIAIPVNKSKTVQELVDEISWGISSACTYIGCDAVMHIADYAEFIEVGKTSIKSL